MYKIQTGCIGIFSVDDDTACLRWWYILIVCLVNNKTYLLHLRILA